MSVPFETIEKKEKCFSKFFVSPGHLIPIQNLIPGWDANRKIDKTNEKLPISLPGPLVKLIPGRTTKVKVIIIPASKKTIQRQFADPLGYSQSPQEQLVTPQNEPFSTPSATETDEPCAHVGKQHITPDLSRKQGATCLIQRNVTLISFLDLARICRVLKVVLTLTVNDQEITITKPARACCTVRTGHALPLDLCVGTKAHRSNELRSPRTFQTAAHHRHAHVRARTLFCKGSGSQRLAHPPQHTMASSGKR